MSTRYKCRQIKDNYWFKILLDSNRLCVVQIRSHNLRIKEAHYRRGGQVACSDGLVDNKKSYKETPRARQKVGMCCSPMPRQEFGRQRQFRSLLWLIMTEVKAGKLNPTSLQVNEVQCQYRFDRNACVQDVHLV